MRPDAALIVLKTGNLKVVTDNTKSAMRDSPCKSGDGRKELSRGTTLDAIKDKPYDKYNCTLSNVQLFFLEKSHDWQTIAFNPDASESLVRVRLCRHC